VVWLGPLFDLVRNVYFVLFDFPFRKPELGKRNKDNCQVIRSTRVINSLSYLFSRPLSPLFTHFVTPVIEGCLGRRSQPIYSDPIVWVGSLKRAPPGSYDSQTQDPRLKTPDPIPGMSHTLEHIGGWGRGSAQRSHSTAQNETHLMLFNDCL